MNLGQHPLCEASAALRATWDPDLILVADNEVHGSLFGFRLVDGRLTGMETLEMPSKHKPRDIEALAPLPDGRLLVVGSHSRNKRCEVKAKRRRLRALAWENGALSEVAYADSNEGWSFGDPERCESFHFADARVGVEQACKALALAERQAALGTEPEAAKPEAGCMTLDIEGAAYIAPELSEKASGVWLGLRRPLVDDKAMLLRLVWPSPALQFDRVVLVDLEGNGIRELAVHDGQLWIVGGSAADSDEPHRLWRLSPLDLVEGHTDLKATSFGLLPSGSEGLVFDGDTPLVVTDGAEGDEACDEQSRQYRQ